MGPSGSGKSTLMHILAGLDKPTEGEVTIAGTEITELNDTQLTRLRREHVGFIFQFFNLLPMLTARENIVLPLNLAGTLEERLGRGAEREGRARSGSRTGRPSSRAVSSSGWRSPARSCPGRR